MTGPRASIDVESILTGLLDDAETTAAGVSTELPAGFRYPWGRVTLLPGGGQADGDHEDHHLNRDRIQLEAFGDTRETARGKGQARDLIEELVTLALNAVGAYPRGVITGVSAESSPYWLPDPEDDGPRYVAVVAVFSHPSPA